MKRIAILFLFLNLLISCHTTHTKTVEIKDNNYAAGNVNSADDTIPKVTGIGGIFFFSDDPSKLREWYAVNLGLAVNEWGSSFEFRNANRPEEINYLQWSPFNKGHEYFAPSTREFMINYRVQNIEGLVTRLKAKGVTVVDTIERYEYGKFVHIMDMEGNKIELWEPVDSVLTKNGRSDHKMNIFETEFWGITNGMFITFVGLIAIAIVIYRWKRKELSLLSFGLFCLIYGIRWLAQTPTMQVLVGFPFTQPYFERLLSYLIAIPIAAFFVLYFGSGIYNSMLWVFRTVVAYALVVIALDLFREVSISTPSYHPVAVILWCLVWAINLVFIKRKHDIELKVIRIVFIILLVTIGHDQMTFMGFLPWEIHLEHTGLLIFSIGQAFIAGHHFFTGEKKLLAIEQEIEIARRIQYAILPAGLPLPGRVEFAAKYIPMSTVAGDFYDIQTDEEDNVGILIADVSGHGVGAALIASMLKIAFTSQMKHLPDPAKVLTEINTILQGNMEYSFITACCIYIDIDNGEFRYANAGHPPPLLWKSKEKQWQTCSLHGTAIGPIPNASYTNETIHIGESDRLVLYTDGITEASNKTGELYGIKRLTSFFETHASDTARSVIDNFTGQLEAWSGRTHKQSFEDDITIIVIDKVMK